MELLSEADESSTGPASLMVADPDGNTILPDQHVTTTRRPTPCATWLPAEAIHIKMKGSGMKLFSTTFTRGRSPRAASLFFMTALGLCAGLVAEVTGRQQRPAEGEVKVTTVFLVRHAEKSDVPGQDPPLSDAGKLRAEALARLLQNAGVKGVYTSQYQRTLQTGEPLARRLGLTATPVALGVKPSNPREVTDESVRELTKKVEAHAGEAVLIVGHTNSVPDVIKMLGGDPVPKMDEGRFDDLFVVTVYGAGRAKVVRLRYGNTE